MSARVKYFLYFFNFFCQLETVRIWIKSGKLKVSLDNNKEGHKITEDELKEFVETQKPKYRKFLPLCGLFLSSLTDVSSILGSLAGFSYKFI